MMFGLRVDVDTLWGLQQGVKNLLDLFDEFQVKATFFIPFGPDSTGKAIKRVFHERGFFQRMVRLRGVYGGKGILYGTLLPAPRMGEAHPKVLLEIEKRGHEVGLHGYDHGHWRDDLLKMGEREIGEELKRAFTGFQRVFHRPPHGTAAPGFRCTEKSLWIQEEFSFRYSSDTRGSSPFFPVLSARIGEKNEQILKTLQLPVTLPTLDELIPLREEKKLLEMVDLLNSKWLNGLNHQSPITDYHLYTAHAEVEGGPKISLFREFLLRTVEKGECPSEANYTLHSLAQKFLTRREEIPKCSFQWGRVPGRTMEVSWQTDSI